MNLIPIFNVRIVLELIRAGFEVRKVEENRKYPGHLVHYFDDIPEVQAYIPRH